jgi:hypothetical protein
MAAEFSAWNRAHIRSVADFASSKCRACRRAGHALAGEPARSAAVTLQLVLSICSIVEGAACHELPPTPLKEGTTMIGCLMASQVEGAKWVAAHPNQYIRRITCAPAGRFAKI